MPTPYSRHRTQNNPAECPATVAPRKQAAPIALPSLPIDARPSSIARSFALHLDLAGERCGFLDALDDDQAHRESSIWQRHFWEHQIRNDLDFERHADYIHYNPVKHGYAKAAAKWPYSTFHRYVANGVYARD